MPTNSGEGVFTSWKEIASFFGKGVRTVQRWEQKFGLPISRPTAAKNVVLATESELREWIRRSSSQLAADEGTELADEPSHNGDGNSADFARRLQRLEEDTARLARIVATFADRLDEISSSISADPSNSGAKTGATLVKRPTVKPMNLTRK